MHELSVARGIADIVCGLVEKKDRARIRAINVDVGDLSGVVPDSLEFCFQAICPEYSLPPESLTIHHIPFACFCRTCRRDFLNTSGVVVCPTCRGYETEVRSGRELRVATIDLDDEPKEES